MSAYKSFLSIVWFELKVLEIRLTAQSTKAKLHAVASITTTLTKFALSSFNKYLLHTLFTFFKP